MKEFNVKLRHEPEYGWVLEGGSDLYEWIDEGWAGGPGGTYIEDVIAGLECLFDIMCGCGAIPDHRGEGV